LEKEHNARKSILSKSGLPAKRPARRKVPNTSDQKILRDLEASELQFRRLFEAAQDGILILDGSTGLITEANQFIIDMLGYSRKELLGKNLWEIGAFIDIKRSKRAFKELQKKSFIRYEDLPLESKDGKRMEVEFVSNVYKVNDHKVIQCNIRDISIRKTSERKLAFLATHDSLTGLPNRILLYDRFHLAASQAERNGKKIAILSTDMDKFKKVNDKLGHDIGDRLFIKVVERLSGILRKSDTIARMGGDEFVMLIPELADTGAVIKTAQKIISAVQKEFIINGYKIKITISIGVVLYPDDGDNIHSLLRNADKLLYQAKQKGRNTFVISFQPDFLT
jgi:diguanylate cyclase (GGDEF)-like protein/PAS domain S-box-containing protein